MIVSFNMGYYQNETLALRYSIIGKNWNLLNGRPLNIEKDTPQVDFLFSIGH